MKYFLLMLIFYLISCGEVTKNENGELGKHCYDNGSCNEGLICGNNKICLELKCKSDSCTETNKTVCSIKDKKILCECDEGYILDGEICKHNLIECKKDSCGEENRTTCSVKDNKIVCDCNQNYTLVDNTCIKILCTDNNDCDEGEKCYAAYCSSSVPQGELLFQLDFLNKAKTDEVIGCDNTLIKNVKLNIKRDDVVLNAEGVNSYNNGDKFKYEQIVSCKEINAKDLINPYHIGYDKNDHTWGPLQQNKEYTIVTTFLDKRGKVPIGMEENGYEYKVLPLVGASKPAKNLKDDSPLSVEVEKVQSTDINISWNIIPSLGQDPIREGNDAFCYTRSSSREKVDMFYIRLSLDGTTTAPCDDQGVCDFEGFNTVTCITGTVWEDTLSVKEEGRYTLEIYAVSNDNKIRYQLIDNSLIVKATTLAKESITLDSMKLNPVAK